MENYCEPIIDKETFDRLQLYNKYAPREFQKPQGHFSENRALLSDLLYCGVCGKKAFIDRRKAKGKLYETYYCNNKHVGFRKHILDKLVIEKGIELLSDKQYQKTVQNVTEGLKMTFSSDTPNLSNEAEIAKIDRKIERISTLLEESDDVPVTMVKRLAELEKQRAEIAQSIQPVDPDARDKILAECDRLRLSILAVLQNKKSATDELRSALSIFIDSVVIYPESKVLIRYTLPGFAKVASTARVNVQAPPEENVIYSQLFEVWCSV